MTLLDIEKYRICLTKKQDQTLSSNEAKKVRV